MSKLTAFLGKELKEVLPPTLYFFAVFEIVVVARELVGNGDGLTMTTTSAAAISALIMGKAILLGDALPMLRWFESRRMVNVLWRTLLYMLVVLVFQVLEDLIPAVRHDGLGAAISDLGGVIQWRRFWGTHFLLASFTFLYSFAAATIEIIGRKRFRAEFFGVTTLSSNASKPRESAS